MDITYEKYSDRSFAVRGTRLEDKTQRSEIIKKLDGSCIWNIKLKNGPGLLVSINPINTQILETLVRDYNLIAGMENRVKVRKTTTAGVDKTATAKKTSPAHSDSDDTSHSVDVSPKFNRRVDAPHEKVGNSMAYRSPAKTGSAKTQYSSDSDTESDSDSDSRQGHRSRASSSSDSASDSRSYRSERSNSKRSPRSSKRSSSDNSESRYKRGRSPPSSDSSVDSSEDERIQLSIKRRNTKKTSVTEINSAIDSETEDIITLSRRLRAVIRRLSALELKVSTD